MMWLRFPSLFPGPYNLMDHSTSGQFYYLGINKAHGFAHCYLCGNEIGVMQNPFPKTWIHFSASYLGNDRAAVSMMEGGTNNFLSRRKVDIVANSCHGQLFDGGTLVFFF